MKANTKFMTLFGGILIVTLSYQSDAHHSFAMFDNDKCQIVAGTVRNYDLSYPHAWIWITSRAKNGGTDIWGFEGASPAELRRYSNWTRNSLQPGDKIEVAFHPLKDGRKGGSFDRVKLPDGRQIGYGFGAIKDGEPLTCNSPPPVSSSPSSQVNTTNANGVTSSK